MLHDFTMLFTFTYFASFTGYEDDILKGISNLQVQESKFGGKIYKFGGIFFKALNSAEVMKFVFSKSGYMAAMKHNIEHTGFLKAVIIQSHNCAKYVRIRANFEPRNANQEKLAPISI